MAIAASSETCQCSGKSSGAYESALIYGTDSQQIRRPTMNVKRTQKYILVVAAVALLAAFVVLVDIWRSPNPTGLIDAVTPENFDRIKLGMSEREVEDILGRPADREYHPWDISVFLAPAPGTSPCSVEILCIK